MLGAKTSTRYSGGKVWAKDEDGGKISAINSKINRKSSENGLQSGKSTKITDTAKSVITKQRILKEMIQHDTGEGPKCAPKTKFKETVSKHENKDCTKKSSSEISSKTTNKKKLKKLVKATGHVVTHLYHYLRRLPMPNEEKVRDIIEKWNTKQLDKTTLLGPAGQPPLEIQYKTFMDYASHLVSLSDVTCRSGSEVDRKLEKRQLQRTEHSPQEGNEIKTQPTFLVDPDAIQFMDREYREAYVCHTSPAERADSSIQKAILASTISVSRCKDAQFTLNQPRDIFSTPEITLQLEILVVNGYPRSRKYFVPNGYRGLKWIRKYLTFNDTTGILSKEEIFEYNVSEAYVRRFRILFPGKVLIADIRINRQIFKPIQLDLDKIFRKEAHKSTSRKSISNYDGEDVDKFQDQVKIQAEAVDRNNNNKIVEHIIYINNPNTEHGLQDNAQIETDNEVAELNDVIKTSTKEVTGVKSDSKLLAQEWVKDLLIGNFPKVKDSTKAPPEAFSVPEVDGQDNDRSLLIAIVRFGKELKIKIIGKAQVPMKYDTGDVQV